jgi:hypothetical protein
MQQQVRQRIITSSLFAVLFWLGVVLVVNYTTPLASGWVVALFYSLLFCAIFFATYPLQVYIRQRWLPHIWEVQDALAKRQAVLVSLLAVLLLYLQAEHLLFWWVALSLGLFILFLEVFFNL